jgi:hypothetical protein
MRGMAPLRTDAEWPIHIQQPTVRVYGFLRGIEHPWAGPERAIQGCIAKSRELERGLLLKIISKLGRGTWEF